MSTEATKGPSEDLIFLKTHTGVYVVDATWSTDRYWSPKINVSALLFDGKKAESTRMKHWGRLASVPAVIERVIAATTTYHGWALKAGFPVTEQTPAEISYDEMTAREVVGLYEAKSEVIPERIEPFKGRFAVLEEDSKFEPIDPPFPVQHSLLDVLRVHPVMLPARPCRMGAEESYAVIRNHVKSNIDPRVAEITSDYDFCLTVKKRIALESPAEYTTDVNNSGWFQKRKRKPKMVTRYRTHRQVEVYAVAPKARDGYPVVNCFVGENYQDLQANIESFLHDLMAMINEPLVDCPNCKGMGVLLGGENAAEA